MEVNCIEEIKKVNNQKMKFDRYTQNLKFEHPFVISYDTKVAEVKGDELIQLGCWSVTTQKHINYAARELNLKLILKLIK